MNEIADKIELALQQTFSLCNNLDSGINDYALFFDKAIHNEWVIVFFCANKDKLEQSLKNSACYQFYTTLTKQLEPIDVKSAIYFESGDRPADVETFKQLLNQLAKRYDGGKDICDRCGHDFNKHALIGYSKNDKTPTEGWITCPEDDCNCFMTWDNKSTNR